MNAIALVMVLDRWPKSLDSALDELDPFVDKKVVVVDGRHGFVLDDRQAARFDVVRPALGAHIADFRREGAQLARALNSVWGFILDADEFIDAPSLLAIRAVAAREAEASAFLTSIFNYVGGGRWTTSYAFRLIRLRAPIDYRHEVHESVSQSLTANGLTWRYIDAPIQHLDFLDPVPGKRARYRAQLEAVIAEGHDLAFLLTLYAIELFWSGESDAALGHLDRAIRIAGNPQQNSRFEGRDDFPQMLKAQVLSRLGDVDAARQIFAFLYERAEPRVRAEAALGLAGIATRSGDKPRSLSWVEASLRCHKTADGVFSRAAALCDLGQPLRACQALRAGLRLNRMAASPLTLKAQYSGQTFGLQCVLHPSFTGVDRLTRAIAAQL